MKSEMNAAWRDKAACSGEAGRDPSLANAWIIRSGTSSSKAIRICKEICPVRTECLIDAVCDLEAMGYRGGIFFDLGVVSRADSKDIMEELGVIPTTSQRQRWARARQMGTAS